MRQPHVAAAQAEIQGPGWGFGFGGAVLVDAALAATPQNNGTMQWGRVWAQLVLRSGRAVEHGSADQHRD